MTDFHGYWDYQGTPWYNTSKAGKTVSVTFRGDAPFAVGNSMFAECATPQTMTLPNGVNAIGESATVHIYYAGSNKQWEAISGFENVEQHVPAIHYNGTRTAVTVESGELDSAFNWRLNSEGTLTIRGSGVLSASGRP